MPAPKKRRDHENSRADVPRALRRRPCARAASPGDGHAYARPRTRHALVRDWRTTRDVEVSRWEGLEGRGADRCPERAAQGPQCPSGTMGTVRASATVASAARDQTAMALRYRLGRPACPSAPDRPGHDRARVRAPDRSALPCRRHGDRRGRRARGRQGGRGPRAVPRRGRAPYRAPPPTRATQSWPRGRAE